MKTRRHKMNARRLGVWLRKGGFAWLAFGGWLLPLAAFAAETNSSLVWPPPPAEPRIAYVRQISASPDIGVRPAPLMRFANWLTGVTNQSEKLDRPFGLALDEAENLVVTDTAGGAVNYLDFARKKMAAVDPARRHPSAVARGRRSSGRTFLGGRFCLGRSHRF